MKGMLFDIQRSSTVDGPGFRTTVFLKGCNLRCAWCHNPESQSFAPQLLYYQDRCTGCGLCRCVCPHALTACTLCGQCTTVCPNEARTVCGREYTVEEVMKEILRDRLFYRTSGGGATFSGGECLLQPDFLTALLMACRKQGVHTAVDTAGAVPFEVFERILPYTDLFLYDLKCMDSQLHRQWTGAGNEQILSNLSRLLKLGARVWVRIPLIVGFNDTPESMAAIRQFLSVHPAPEKIELLPYHRMGENKARAMGRTPKSFEVPDEEKMSMLRQSLK